MFLSSTGYMSTVRFSRAHEMHVLRSAVSKRWESNLSRTIIMRLFTSQTCKQPSPASVFTWYRFGKGLIMSLSSTGCVRCSILGYTTCCSQPPSQETALHNLHHCCQCKARMTQPGNRNISVQAAYSKIVTTFASELFRSLMLSFLGFNLTEDR